MKPFYEQSGITIYHGDCREVLATFAEQSADLVLTDPPYSEVTHQGARGGAGDEVLVDFPALDDTEIREHFVEMARIASRWVVSFIDWRHIHLFETAPPAGLRFVRHGIWVKPNGAPQFTGDRPGTGWEALAFLHRADVKLAWLGGGRHSVFVENKVNNNQHPTEKPQRLMADLIRFFVGRDALVVDPFMGSGTTLVAAKYSGRRAIGIELEEKYCEIAANRLRQETLPLEVA